MPGLFDFGAQQTQAGSIYANLQTQAAQQDRQLRQIELENFKQRLFQMYQIEEQKKAEKKARRRKLLTLGLGGAAGAVGGLALAPGLATSLAAPGSVGTLTGGGMGQYYGLGSLMGASTGFGIGNQFGG